MIQEKRPVSSTPIFKIDPIVRNYSWEQEQQLLTSKLTLEKLRSRKYVRDGAWYCMQKLGDFGRKYFGWMNVRFRY